MKIINNCGHCLHTGNIVLTSYPPKYRCEITGELHYGSDDCNVEFEPVRHGEWIENTLFGLGVEKYHGFKCSVCNEHTGNITNFCPNCGAKMDKE